MLTIFLKKIGYYPHKQNITLNVDTIRLDYAVWQRHLGNRLAKPWIIRLACQQGRSSTVTAEDPSQRPSLVAFIGHKYAGALLTWQHSVIEQRRRGELSRLLDWLWALEDGSGEPTGEECDGNSSYAIKCRMPMGKGEHPCPNSDFRHHQGRRLSANHLVIAQ